MGMSYGDFSKPVVRSALKRGLSRQVVAQAEEADLPALLRLTHEVRPNAKALQRCAQRVQGRRGVVRVALGPTGLVMILRNRRQMISRQNDAELYAEEALFYTRVLVTVQRGDPGYHISRAAFSLHALERLVERSPVALDRPLLPAVDAEAVTILRQAARAALIEDGTDHYATAAHPGVWAGRVDLSELEPEWDLSYANAEARVPVFSARTFLAPDQMRPTVWLRWRADPALAVS